MEKKVMSDYSLYCTEAQTRKAFALGAPIEVLYTKDDYQQKIPTIRIKDKFVNYDYFVPTAEQMLGWLEEQEIHIIVVRSDDGFDVTYYYVLNERYGDYNYTSRKEATLAAIDAALKYLTNNKK